MKLVIFDRDWADEFSPFGFAIMTDEEFRSFTEHYSTPRTWYFGTNEGFEGEVLSTDCKVTDITQEQANTLVQLFQLKRYDWNNYIVCGLFPTWDPDDEED